jgi:hypothetical protein
MNIRAFLPHTIFAVFAFFCCLFFLFPQTVDAATVHYYVDPDGTDSSGFGTSSGSGAFQTLQYAVTNVANPTTDTIIINISGDA